MNRSIGDEKMRSADMQAPKVKGVALIIGAAGAEGVWAERNPIRKARHLALGLRGPYHRSRHLIVPYLRTTNRESHRRLGGRSPTQSVLLVPSVMSASRVCESRYKTPFRR